MDDHQSTRVFSYGLYMDPAICFDLLGVIFPDLETTKNINLRDPFV